MLLQSIASKLSQCGIEVFERKLTLLVVAKNYIELDQDFAIVAFHYSDTEAVIPAQQVTLHDEIPAEEPTHPEMPVTLHDDMAEEQATLCDEISNPEMPEEEPAQLEILETATFPVKMQKRERAKGSTTMAIGLPKNKKRKVVKTVPYFRKPTKTRQVFTSEEGILKVERGDLIDETDVVSNLNELPSCVKDSNVDIGLVKSFFHR